ncbi:hypothetical protein [Nonlabens sp.]|uniref:hypothetical protein n=1 Tax=Nonlabens sp. TaxID=1888209 RepID=UPI0025D9C445|nr:hypothetical protein [Nonlabens sp.]
MKVTIWSPVAILFLVLASHASVQVDFPPDVDDTAPISGWLIAAVAAVALGIQKARPKR